MTLLLYELCGEDRDLRFSPYVWRIKMALAHKNLEYDSDPARFLEKQKYSESGSKTLPVLKHGQLWISDSWTIAKYLEDTFADRPSLFGGAMGQAQARFISVWADRTIVRSLFPLLVADILAHLDSRDAQYFRKTREPFLRCTIEEAAAGKDQHLQRFRKSLTSLNAIFLEQPYLCGDQPAYADYALFGPFQWARIVRGEDVLREEDTAYDWRERMLDLYDGLARQAKCC